MIIAVIVTGAVLWLAVCLLGAGKADLSITVIDPAGHTMPFDIQPLEHGERVIYRPDSPGTHKVNATYGGINVPGNLDILVTLLHKTKKNISAKPNEQIYFY